MRHARGRDCVGGWPARQGRQQEQPGHTCLPSNTTLVIHDEDDDRVIVLKGAK